MARCRVTIPNLREHQGDGKEKLDPLREIINALHRVYLLTNLSVAREHKLLDYKAPQHWHLEGARKIIVQLGGY